MLDARLRLRSLPRLTRRLPNLRVWICHLSTLTFSGILSLTELKFGSLTELKFASLTELKFGSLTDLKFVASIYVCVATFGGALRCRQSILLKP